MAISSFSYENFLIRFAAALALVFASFNPLHLSWFHWFLEAENKFTPPLLITGIILFIGWGIYLKATFDSLGLAGTIIIGILFGALLWALFYYGLLSLQNTTIVTWVILVMLGAFMAIGMSWSHIHRRMTGQVDVDEADIN